MPGINELSSSKISTEAQILLLDQRATYQAELLGKIVEIHESVRDLLHVHESRITVVESQNLNVRIIALERYKWIMVGAVAVISFIGGIILNEFHIRVAAG